MAWNTLSSYVRTPTATGGDIGTPFKKQTKKYTVIAR